MCYNEDYQRDQPYLHYFQRLPFYIEFWFIYSAQTGQETVTFGGKSVMFQHGKNDSWLGGSIDVYTSGTSDVFAVCRI